MDLIYYLIMGIVGSVGTTPCSKTTKKGPYSFKHEPTQVITPSKRNITMERIRITQDVELTMVHRSYWTSYCYNGGALDPNTGCINQLTQDLPKAEEISEWLKKQQCAVGPDCTDCWGSDARICLKPGSTGKHWVAGKELTKGSNNNHFPFHTCNLSWRCGLHKARFPTFATRGSHGWVIYTEHANGTQIQLDNRETWNLGDALIIKTADYKFLQDEFTASCFTNTRGGLACYDNTFSNFIEFKYNWACQKQFCYRSTEISPQTQETGEDLANLQAASIEDLKAIVNVEHQLNEELRYNFAIVTSELEQLRALVSKIILSTAKIDDRLIGNILGVQARSQFLSETVFLLAPCAEPPRVDSNCFKDMIYRDGRWMKNANPKDCINMAGVERLELVKKVEMWFPELENEKYLGISENFDGWTYYAHEKENLNRAMEWVQNNQATSSLADLVEYPKEFLNHALTGFLTTHAITIIVVIGITWFICQGRQRQAENEGRIVITTRKERQEFQQEVAHQPYSRTEVSQEMSDETSVEMKQTPLETEIPLNTKNTTIILISDPTDQPHAASLCKNSKEEYSSTPERDTTTSAQKVRIQDKIKSNPIRQRSRRSKRTTKFSRAYVNYV